MAELKAGTTVGGSVVWTQANFPLNPTGNTLLYKTYKVYSEHDKPSAADNDFVSKASGGKYGNKLTIVNGVVISGTATGTEDTNSNGIFPGNGDGASKATVNLDIKSWQGIGISSTLSGSTRTIWINARNGDITSEGTIRGVSVSMTNAPTANDHLTNKAYVDSRFNAANNTANTKVAKAGDTMTGVLTVPNIISVNAATLPQHTPRLDQVITIGTSVDFGEY